jgi:hypothetical protein
VKRSLRLPAALVAMAALGPIVLLALWPSLLAEGAPFAGGGVSRGTPRA